MNNNRFPNSYFPTVILCAPTDLPHPLSSQTEILRWAQNDSATRSEKKRGSYLPHNVHFVTLSAAVTLSTAAILSATAILSTAVILSAAKDLPHPLSSQTEILRCAQNDSATRSEKKRGSYLPHNVHFVILSAAVTLSAAVILSAAKDLA